jgi:hypothetical protein
MPLFDVMPLFEHVALIAEVGDDLELTAECPDIGGQYGSRHSASDLVLCGQWDG